MAKLTLAERARRVREELGYGKPGMMTAFAKQIGVAPASIHDIESGKTKELGKSFKGYVRLGANPLFLEKGVGPVMLFKQIERKLEIEEMIGYIEDLDDDRRKTVMELVRHLRRSMGGPPDQKDPFREDPPKNNTQ